MASVQGLEAIDFLDVEDRNGITFTARKFVKFAVALCGNSLNACKLAQTLEDLSFIPICNVNGYLLRLSSESPIVYVFGATLSGVPYRMVSGKRGERLYDILITILLLH